MGLLPALSSLAVLLFLFGLINISHSDESFASGNLKPLHPGTHACFSPDTNLSIALRDEMLDDHHKRYQFMGSRWTNTASGSGNTLGRPVTLTWSIAPDGCYVDSGYNEPAGPSNLQARLLQIFGSRTAYMDMLTQAFGIWTSIAGIRFVYEPNDDNQGKDRGMPGQLGVRGDIRLFGHHIDGDYGVLAYASSPDAGDMVIDTNDRYFVEQKDWMFQVLGHEIGHALGLSHSCPMTNTKLMEPLINTNFIGPQHDDILGAMTYYGDRLEPNDQINVAASGIGSVTATATTISTLSLHSSSDIDFYKFTTGTGVTAVQVKVTPTGQSYTTGAVGTGIGSTGGACGGTFPAVDTNRIFNLGLEIYDSAGSLLGSSNTGALGAMESLTVSGLTSGGTYYVRVFAVGSTTTTGVQMYSVSAQSVTATGPPPATSSRPPATSSRPPATSSRPPATSSRPPATSSRPPATSSRAPAASSSRPPASPSKACGSSFCI